MPISSFLCKICSKSPADTAYGFGDKVKGSQWMRQLHLLEQQWYTVIVWQ